LSGQFLRITCERMLRRCHRDQFDVADLQLLDSGDGRVLRSADADIGDARLDELGDGALSASTCKCKVTVGNFASKACTASTRRGVGNITSTASVTLGSKPLSRAFTLARRSPTPSETVRTFDSAAVPASVRTGFRVRSRSNTLERLNTLRNGVSGQRHDVGLT
jgi:hypothetical protein